MNMNLIKSILFTTTVICAVSSCGPTKEQEQIELKKEDSAADIQSNEALDRANALFEADTLKNDTLKKSK